MTLLPRWDLRDFYKDGMTDPLLQKDLDHLTEKVEKFSQDYLGNINSLPPQELLHSLQVYEEIQEHMGKIGSYAYLVYAVATTHEKTIQFYQGISEALTTASSALCFFPLELNQREELLQIPEIKKYVPWLETLRLYKPHQLRGDLEKLMKEKSLTGQQAWVRLFDETLASLRFSLTGEDLTLSDILNKFRDTDPAIRQQAAHSLAEGLESKISLLSYITNTLAKDKAINDRWYGYARPVSNRNIENRIEDEVVDALVQTVKDNYKNLTHRYYALKAKIFGKEVLDYWDRNAPFPHEEKKEISWSEATKMVLEAYHSFSPSLSRLGRQFIENNWIDAPPLPGKQSGAFAHPTVPSVHPYLLLNYHGKLTDVMTLAHEMGHGIHQLLAAPQGYLMADTPLTLAETASVFGEMLTFQSCLAQASTPTERKFLLAGKIEDMLNTSVRQIGLYCFESRVHEERQKGELSTEQLGNIWMETQGENLGPSIRLDEGYKVFWAYIPHLIHTPFYVYAYAFGECLVNSLFAIYQSQNEEGRQDFAQKYETLLKAGGTLHHKELLAPFGLDASHPKFWQQGLDLITTMIDELEKLL
jgi:oligoendopeptidase F